jgi:hypothetical protein
MRRKTNISDQLSYVIYLRAQFELYEVNRKAQDSEATGWTADETGFDSRQGYSFQTGSGAHPTPNMEAGRFSNASVSEYMTSHSRRQYSSVSMFLNW